MRKVFFGKGIPFVLVIILIAIVTFWVVKAPIMSSYLSSKLNVPVSMTGIKMRPSYTVISRFRIANPKGFRMAKAFSAKTITVNYGFKNLLATPSVIDQIVLRDLFLGIEFSNSLGTENNWTQILSGFEKKAGKKQGRSVLIKKLVLENLDVEIHGMGVTALLAGSAVQKKHIDHLEFNNIDSKNGFPTERLIQAIFGSAGLQDYIKKFLSPGGVIDNILSPFLGDESEHKIKKPLPAKAEAS